MEDNKKIELIIESNNQTLSKSNHNLGLRNLIPNEVQNMNKLMQNLSKINSYSWEVDGNKVKFKLQRY